MQRDKKIVFDLLDVRYGHTGLALTQWTVAKEPADCFSKSTGLMLPR